MEKKETNQKNDSEEDSEWKDCAHPIGMLIKFTGVGENKKFHYKKFKFRGAEYQLEDFVILNPEYTIERPYVAIIKDIYIQAKEKYVKMEVQWFYRPDDVDKKYVRNWKPKDSSDLFYSFHRDEVDAESVKDNCIVNFVPANKKIPDRREYHGFIVQKVYDIFTKKLQDFDSNKFSEIQKNEINLLVAETISRVSHNSDNEKEKMTISRVGNLPDNEEEEKTFRLKKRKQSFPKRFIKEIGGMSPEKCGGN